MKQSTHDVIKSDLSSVASGVAYTEGGKTYYGATLADCREQAELAKSDRSKLPVIQVFDESGQMIGTGFDFGEVNRSAPLIKALRDDLRLEKRAVQSKVRPVTSDVWNRLKSDLNELAKSTRETQEAFIQSEKPHWWHGG